MQAIVNSDVYIAKRATVGGKCNVALERPRRMVHSWRNHVMAWNDSAAAVPGSASLISVATSVLRKATIRLRPVYAPSPSVMAISRWLLTIAEMASPTLHHRSRQTSERESRLVLRS